MAKVSIEEAKRLFTEWRKTRPHARSATPPEIRRVALEIKDVLGSHAAQVALGLSGSSLSIWERERRRRRPRARKYSTAIKSSCGRGEGMPSLQTSVRSDATPAVTFIEIPPPAAAQCETSGQGLGVEWRRTDGAAMRVSGLSSVEQIGVLASQFLGPGQRGQS